MNEWWDRQIHKRKSRWIDGESIDIWIGKRDELIKKIYE